MCALRYLRPALRQTDPGSADAGSRLNRASRTLAPALALLAAVWGLACASASPSSRVSQVEAALAAALADETDQAGLRIFVECSRETGPHSVELFGSGVGILDGRRQFDAPPSVIAAALRVLQDSDFAAMPETLGGPGSGPARPPRSGTDHATGSAVRLVCRVELDLNGLSQAVVQLARGFQSPALRRLALELLRICEVPAGDGIGAADLADGLAKIATRELAPETFHLLLHRRPDPSDNETGFLLRVDGRRSTARPYDSTSGFGPTYALTLSADDLARLAGELLEAEVQELPVNLWATGTSDLSLAVLDHRRSIQARRFANMEPTTHGPRQLSFDRIEAKLRRLAARSLADGRIAPPD